MKLIVATDFSPLSRNVLDVAARLAQALPAKLWIIHVADPEPAFKGYGAGERKDRGETALEYREEHRLVQAIAEDMRSRGLQAEGLLVQGPPARAILREADDVAADMIIMGSHGYGAVISALLGSVSRQVLRKSRRPVIIVPVSRDPPHSH